MSDLPWSPYAKLTRDAAQQPLQVLYEDEALLAINKPAGLLTHEGWGQDDVALVDLMRELVRGPKVHLLHRLDRATSGVVLFAQDADAARIVGLAFEQRRVKKGYLALTRGLCPESGHIDHPVPRERGELERVEAQSDFERLATQPLTLPRATSLVRVWPRSGRAHQIRRHLKHINHPIIGDSSYGKASLNQAFRERYGLERLALHAHTLELEHPTTGRALHIKAPLALDLAQAFERMGYDAASWA